MNINELKEGTYIAKNKIDSSTHLVRITGKFPMLRVKRALCIDIFSDIAEKKVNISEDTVTSIETEPEDTIVVSEEGISITDARDVLNMFRLNI